MVDFGCDKCKKLFSQKPKYSKNQSPKGGDFAEGDHAFPDALGFDGCEQVHGVCDAAHGAGLHLGELLLQPLLQALVFFLVHQKIIYYAWNFPTLKLFLLL